MKLRKLFVAVVLLTTTMASAQQQQMQMPEIPTDDSVRIGKLDNGLTYGLHLHTLPPNRAISLSGISGSVRRSCLPPTMPTTNYRAFLADSAYLPPSRDQHGYNFRRTSPMSAAHRPVPQCPSSPNGKSSTYRAPATAIPLPH